MNEKVAVCLYVTKQINKYIDDILAVKDMPELLNNIERRNNAGRGAVIRLALTFVLRHHRKSFIAYLLQLAQEAEV